MTHSVDIIGEQILSWHAIHYSHQRVSQSLAHLAQEGETFVLVGSLNSPNFIQVYLLHYNFI